MTLHRWFRSIIFPHPEISSQDIEFYTEDHKFLGGEIRKRGPLTAFPLLYGSEKPWW